MIYDFLLDRAVCRQNYKLFGVRRLMSRDLWEAQVFVCTPTSDRRVSVRFDGKSGDISAFGATVTNIALDRDTAPALVAQGCHLVVANVKLK